MPRRSSTPLRARRGTRAVACALAAVVLSTGCATFMNGPTQRVTVASDPPGARVFLGYRPLGVTPTVVTLDRRDPDPGLRLEKECYRTKVVRVPRRTSRWAAGNLVFAGGPVNEYSVGAWLVAMVTYTTVGVLVDRRRGGAFAFPNLLRATLERLPESAENDSPGSQESTPACRTPGPVGWDSAGRDTWKGSR